jgi:hypothetical protein
VQRHPKVILAHLDGAPIRGDEMPRLKAASHPCEGGDDGEAPLHNPPQVSSLVIGDLPGFGKKFSGGHGNARIVLMHDVLGGQPWLAPWLEVGH